MIRLSFSGALKTMGTLDQTNDNAASLSEGLSPLNLDDINITSDTVNISSLQQDLDNFIDSAALDAILNQGADPIHFSREYEDKLQSAEVQAIQAYIAESQNLLSLHKQIKECDDVLGSMEDLLGRFANDLGNISSEIRSIQDQSQEISQKLENRRSLQSGLSDMVSKLTLQPSLIHAIVEGDMSREEFSTHLNDLSDKLDFVLQDEATRRSAAYRDISPELERLRLKAVGRCREFLLEKIWDFRRPRTNLQIKQNIMLRYHNMASFLQKHGGQIYVEVRSGYVDKVSQKIGDLFRSYWAALEQLEENIVGGPTDLLGAPDPISTSSTSGGGGGSSSSSVSASLATSASTFTSFFQSASTTSTRNTKEQSSSSSSSSSSSRGGEVYALGDRSSVLTQLEAPPIVPHAVESQKMKFPFEILFRSLNSLLMDAAAHEYLFCREFWGPSEGGSIFSQLFRPALGFLEGSIGADIQELNDPLALMLAIRITREHALVMARKHNPALDSYFDKITLLLWPRLKAVFDTQLASIPPITGGGANKALLLLPPMPSHHHHHQHQPVVHIMTDRYAHLMASTLLLYADDPSYNSPLDTNIEQLRYRVTDQLLAISRTHVESPSGGAAFLIVNFSHIVNVLKDAGTKGLPSTPGSLTWRGAGGGGGDGRPLGVKGAAVLKEFEEPLSRATSLYVDKQLEAALPQLVVFVTKGEAAAAAAAAAASGSGTVVIPGYEPSKAAPLATDFTKRWESIVRDMNTRVNKDFGGGGGGAGRTLLQACFTQLLLLWNRFLELVKKQGGEGEEVVHRAVTIAAVMYGLKEYRV
jgi:vacuolar protein sorting-associated protein 52